MLADFMETDRKEESRRFRVDPEPKLAQGHGDRSTLDEDVKYR